LPQIQIQFWLSYSLKIYLVFAPLLIPPPFHLLRHNISHLNNITWENFVNILWSVALLSLLFLLMTIFIINRLLRLPLQLLIRYVEASSLDESPIKSFSLRFFLMKKLKVFLLPSSLAFYFNEDRWLCLPSSFKKRTRFVYIVLFDIFSHKFQRICYSIIGFKGKK
jgi:hypothetical protein